LAPSQLSSGYNARAAGVAADGRRRIQGPHSARLVCQRGEGARFSGFLSARSAGSWGMTTGPQKITLAEMRLRRAWPADLLQRLPLLPLDGDQRRFAPRARPPCSTSATTAPTEWPGSPRCVHWNNGGRPIRATCGSQKVGLTIRILPAASPPPVIDVTSQRAQSPPHTRWRAWTA